MHSSIDKAREPNDTISSARDITLNEIQTLTRNEKVNVQGHLTLGQNPKKEVIKRNGEKGYVKEDCVIEHHTGSATIHIWDNLLTQLRSGNAYSFQNLSVKNYSGLTLLGTTPTTTFQKVDLQLAEVKGPNFFQILRRKLLSRNSNLLIK